MSDTALGTWAFSGGERPTWSLPSLTYGLWNKHLKKIRERMFCRQNRYPRTLLLPPERAAAGRRPFLPMHCWRSWALCFNRPRFKWIQCHHLLDDEWLWEITLLLCVMVSPHIKYVCLKKLFWGLLVENLYLALLSFQAYRKVLGKIMWLVPTSEILSNPALWSFRTKA